MAGLLQPFADAIKLFLKEERNVLSVNSFFFFISPFVSFFVSLCFWLVIFSRSGFMDFKYSLVFFMLCLRIRVYGLVFSGWSSNSKYSLLGSLRGVAQTISYEIPLIFLVFSLIFLCFSFNFSSFFWFDRLLIFLLSFHVFFICFLCCVAETNRAPFDLAEGESELVSGFNVEYGGLKFALIFMGEYATIIWFSFFLSFLFFSLFFNLFFLLAVRSFLFFRSSFPRLRYDTLMYLMWKRFLILVLIVFFIFVRLAVC